MAGIHRTFMQMLDPVPPSTLPSQLDPPPVFRPSSCSLSRPASKLLGKACQPESDPDGRCPFSRLLPGLHAPGPDLPSHGGSGQTTRWGSSTRSEWGCCPTARFLLQGTPCLACLRPPPDRKLDQHARGYTFRGNPTDTIQESSCPALLPRSATCLRGHRAELEALLG